MPSHSGSSSDSPVYPRGEGPRKPGSSPRTLELLTCAHVLVLLLVSAWWFGGQSGNAREFLTWWASLGFVLTFASIPDRYAWKERGMNPILWLLPLLAFDAMVLVGSFLPSFRTGVLDGETLLIPQPRPIWLPTTVRPEATWQALWTFNAVWFSAFNLALIVRKRKTLRFLLGAVVLNTAVLAVFGTVQKLAGAKGLFFDAVPTRQEKFFASFVYHNHWGAYTILVLAAGLGLAWHHARRRGSRGFFHTPAFGLAVLLLLMAATLPLSLSRSTTALGLLFLGIALLHVFARIIATRRRYRESVAPPVLGLAAVVVLGAAALWSVAGESIVVRLEKTREQVAEAREKGGVGGRERLYRDTFRMGRDKPVFGWGMASYPHVFLLYNTTESPVDRLPVFFNDAHSDWLQAFAEHGLIGSALLGLAALVPLLQVRRRDAASPLPAYLWGGCALVALYAWVEFPFGNFAVVAWWWVLFFCAVQYCRLIAREERRDAPPA